MITYDELVELGCLDKLGRISTHWVKNVSNDIVARIVEATSFMPLESKVSHRVLAIRQGITVHPTCRCGKPVMVHPTQAAVTLFSRSCSSQCARTDPQRTSKAQSTCMDRYGAPTHQQSDSGRQCRVDTNVARYGCVSPAANPSIRSKIEQTNLERYGHINIFGSEYGKKAIQATNTRKYGHSSFATSTLDSQTVTSLNDSAWLQSQNHVYKRTLGEIAEELNCSIACVHQHFQQFNIPVRRHQSSRFESSICEWIISMGVVVENDVTINGVRYDICLPEHKILIECDGVYWHGEATAGRGRSYHLNKTTQAKQAGYTLIHIYENEWVYKSNIVKSMLSNRISNTTNRLYARKGIIRAVLSKEAKMFLADNHIQGETVAVTYAYGLYYDNVLMSLITLSTSRFGDKMLEITRFCNRVDYTVVGGFSRLFTHAVKQLKVDTVVSYADRRWGEGSVYRTAGFVCSGTTAPSYDYYKTNNSLVLLNRMRFQKHKLQKILPVFDSTLTEWENMKANGYDRIWNCGNAKWIWKKPA